MARKSVHSNAEDSILPLADVTCTKRKRAGLPWVFVVVFSLVLYVLVSPLRLSSLWTSKLPLVSSGVAETAEKPTVTTELNGNGRTNDVLWDKYSLVLKGQRVFIQYVRS